MIVCLFSSNERPPGGDNHLPNDPKPKQTLLLAAPMQLLTTFAPMAPVDSDLARQWREVAILFSKVGDACISHRLGCNGVAPPQQKVWTDRYATALGLYAKRGPVAAAP